MRFVVRASTRVLIAYANCQHAQQVWRSTTHSEEEVPSDEEDRVPEVERVVDVVVVDDDPGREYDPDGDNHRRGQLGRWFGRRRWLRELAVILRGVVQRSMRGRGRGRLAFLAGSLAVVIGDSDGGCAGFLLHFERLGLFVGHGDDTRW